MHRPAAERLDVAARRARAARPLRDGLGDVPAAALVAIAHRLLAAADDVADVGARRPRPAAPAGGAARGRPSPCTRGSRAGPGRSACRPRRGRAASRRAGRPSTPSSGTAPCRSMRSRSTSAATPAGTAGRPEARPTTGCASSAIRARSATSRSSPRRSKPSHAARSPRNSSSGMISPSAPNRARRRSGAGATASACAARSSTLTLPMKTWFGAYAHALRVAQGRSQVADRLLDPTQLPERLRAEAHEARHVREHERHVADDRHRARRHASI